MSRSPYTDHVVLTNKHSGRRTHSVRAFVIHHMAARWTGKQCAEYFRDTPSRQASTNYAIGYDGDVALNVEEKNRAWTSSSNWADQRAITFELANSSMGHPWRVSDKTIDKAILMLAEMHKRYGLKKASYTGDTNGTLWRHDWFYPTNCPGPYLGNKLSYIADEVNKILRGEKGARNLSKEPSKWAKKAWTWAENEGLMSSRPQDIMKRQEAAAMLRNYDLKDNNKKVSEWAEPSWEWAEKEGLVSGRPRADMTRQEGIAVLHNYENKDKGRPVSEWAEPSFEWALENDLFNADNPHVSVSKQQLAVILRKFAEKFDLA